jgi:NAD(P)H-hydrate epimerase
MRELDRLTIEKYGVPGRVLMEHAGELTAEVLFEQFPHARRGRVLILAGKGNNGGDGLVVARKLTEKKIACDVVLCASKGDLNGDAKANLERFVQISGNVTEAEEPNRVALIGERLQGAVLVVDAILGTGLKQPVGGVLAEVIEGVNASGVPVLAVDIPSGLHSDLGVPFDVSIQAELTVTFGYLKLGQTILPGADLCGELVVADVGLSEEALLEVGPRRHLLERHDLSSLFSPRDPSAHKGSFGHLLILGGSRGKTGAAVLAAKAAMRVGAGLVTLAVPRSVQAVAASLSVEVMTEGLSDDGEGFFSFPSSEELERILRGKKAVVVGPGIGTSKGSRRLVQWLMQWAVVPVLYDADALNCLAEDVATRSLAKVFEGAFQKRILTPHPGEMGRLAGMSAQEVQGSRVGVVERLAKESAAIVVLKGARTLTATPDRRLFINSTGNPGMASGGMGDVLSGIIGGLLVQGVSEEEASAMGVYLHGAAGDRLRSKRGERGIIASDLIDELPETILWLSRGGAG